MAEFPFPAAGPSSRDSSPSPDSALVNPVNREEKLSRAPQRGFQEAWVLLGQSLPRGEPSGRGNCRQTGDLFSPYCILPLLFCKVCFRRRGGGWDGSRPSKDEGWGSPRQFQFVANDLCTIQGQRMICEACAPTHASIHNLVLDYISI